MMKKDEEKKKKEVKDKLKKQQKEERRQQYHKEQAQKEKEAAHKAKQAEKNPFSVIADKMKRRSWTMSMWFSQGQSASDHLPKGTLSRLHVPLS